MKKDGGCEGTLGSRNQNTGKKKLSEGNSVSINSSCGSVTVEKVQASMSVVDSENEEVREEDNALRNGEYSLEKMNHRYCVIVLGGKVMILDEIGKVLGKDNTSAHGKIRYFTIPAFNELFSNNLHSPVGANRLVPISRTWMSEPGRREYHGLCFRPPINNKPQPSNGYYNYWQGFSYEPSSQGSCKKFLHHVFTNIARGNKQHFHYIFGWMADIIQNPGKKSGIALVLRGEQGTGKTVFGQIFGKLFEDHYLLVDDPRHIVGKFNSHMANSILLQADEGFWAGDKQAEGRLKGLITSKFQQIEYKGKDPITMDNHVRLLVTSNNNWVVPAGANERRFATFDVAQSQMQNQEYFRIIFDELENGGYEKLLHCLQDFDLAKVDLYKIPQTTALAEQKLSTFSPEDTWLQESLEFGTFDVTGDGEESSWPDKLICRELHRLYLDFCTQRNVRHPLSGKRFGIYLKKMVPVIERRRATKGDSRPWYYDIPPIEICRKAFEDQVSIKFKW